MSATPLERPEAFGDKAVFTDQEIGVTNLPAYTRYPELFEGARWIWSQNLVLDNVVIARKTVR